MKVAFVASNPSHNDSPPTLKNLEKWKSVIELTNYDVRFFNVSNEITEGNRPLKSSEYQLDRLRVDVSEFDVLVALGNTASHALRKLKLPHFKLPHPSPRNRQLNDPADIQNRLEKCREYVKSNLLKETAC